MPSLMRKKDQRGAALLMAMLTVALVATLAATALWRQWRGVEVEAAERGRTQAEWILRGAQDWGRLILRQDARSGGPDDLSEPWAIPLAESRLSTFLSGDNTSAATPGMSDDAMDAFLSGGITDLQGRLNMFNLIENGQVSQSWYISFSRLFSVLGLPQGELDQCVQALQSSMPRNSASTSTTGTDTQTTGTATSTSGDDESVLIAPIRFDDLRRFGFSAATLARLRPYATWLPAVTTVNLNTAPAEVIYAAINGIDQGTVRKIVQQRSTTRFSSLEDVRRLLNTNTATSTGTADSDTSGPDLNTKMHGVQSSYFLINGQVRIDETAVGQQSVVRRNGLLVQTLDRQPLDNPILSTPSR